MTTLEELKKQAFKNPKVKKYYDELEPEYRIVGSVMKKRIDKGMTQAELAEKIGTKQSAIARFESGDYNPSISMLNKIANALGAKLKISIT